MTQTTFLAHWLGAAVIIQSLCEIYVYKRKKARQVRQHKTSSKKILTSKYSINP